MSKGELVAVAPSGALCILIPLYTRDESNVLDSMEGSVFTVTLTQEKPLGYLLDWEDSGDDIQFFDPKILEMVEVLGEL